MNVGDLFVHESGGVALVVTMQYQELPYARDITGGGADCKVHNWRGPIKLIQTHERVYMGYLLNGRLMYDIYTDDDPIEYDVIGSIDEHG